MKFFLDNNLAPKHASALHALLQPEHEVVHLRDKFPGFTSDAEWLQKLGVEGGWIVISGDLRISRNQHEKQAWQRSGLTIFFLAKGWTHISLLDQHAKLTIRMADIIAIAKRHPTKSGFTIPVSGKISEAF